MASQAMDAQTDVAQTMICLLLVAKPLIRIHGGF